MFNPLKAIKDKYFTKGFVEGKLFAQKEREGENFKIKSFEAESLKNNVVIILNNEWYNPIVGEIKEVNTKKGSVLYTVYDYLSGETSVGVNTPIPFTMQKLQAINNLTPDDIVALFFEGKNSKKEVYKNQAVISSDEVFKRTDYNDWMEKLNENKFFEKYPEYKQA